MDAPQCVCSKLKRAPPPAEPEEPPAEPEEPPELVYGPVYDPDLIFPFPEPEVPVLKPVAQEQEEEDEQEQEQEDEPVLPPLKPVAPEHFDYHFEHHEEDDIVTVLDEIVFIVTAAPANELYEMVIFDKDNNQIVRQGVQSSPEGILMFESIPFLNYENYRIALLDIEQNVFKNWFITIEDRQYRTYDNLFVNGELNREYINLGTFKDADSISGIGKSKAKYYSYLQKLENFKKKTGNIDYIRTDANEDGNYQIELPENLKEGAYSMHVVQVYEDGKVSKNKRYSFNIERDKKISNIWILIFIGLIALLGQTKKLKKYSKPKNNSKKSGGRKRMLTILIALCIIASASIPVQAVSTTPAVFIYEGKLLDSTDEPIITPQTFRLSLWSSDDLVAGDILGSGAINVTQPTYGGWLETHTVTPNTDGTFFLELGSIVPLPDMDFSLHKHMQVEVKTSASPDTSYELMDPTGDVGADTDDRQTIGSTPYTNNADFIDNAELGTSVGDIATLSAGGLWDIDLMPAGTNADSWTIDVDDTIGAGGIIDLIFGTTLSESLSFDIDDDWFEFSNDLSLNQNEIKNVAIDNLAVAPGTPVEGQIYYNTANNNTYVWNGAAWDDITAAGATGVDDLDAVYGADANKKMGVNNAAGLEFESTVAGNIMFDLQSTGDLVIQDAGTTFAIFTDGGLFGLGNDVPDSIFHVDSNAANTTAITTYENTAGKFQLFRTDLTPEGAITGSIGDIAIDGTGGDAYIKNSGTTTNTGWLQFGGQVEKSAVFHAEYSNSTIQGDGGNNKGLLSSYFADGGGTSKYNYYDWTTQNAVMQDSDITISFRLPDDFQSFTSTPLSILYQTSDVVTITNKVDVSLYDTTGTAVSLTGGTGLATAAWTTAGITFGGSPTFTAGDVVTLVIKLSSTNTGFARVSDVIFNYNGT